MVVTLHELGQIVMEPYASELSHFVGDKRVILEQHSKDSILRSEPSAESGDFDDYRCQQ